MRASPRLPLAPDAVSLAKVLFILAFSSLLSKTVSVTYRQRAASSALLAGVSRLYRPLAWGRLSLGLIPSGALLCPVETVMPRTAALTVPSVVAVLGVALLATGAWRPFGHGLAPGIRERIGG